MAPELRKALQVYSIQFEQQSMVSETELELDQIEHVVYCLMRLSASMQNPQPFDHFKTRTSSIVDNDAAKGATLRIEDNFARFDRLPGDLAQRLGYANAERSSYFRYRADHASRLKEGLPGACDDTMSVSGYPPDSQKPTTEASFRPVQSEDTPDRPGELPHFEPDDELLSQGTQTSHGTSIAGGEKRGIPKLPSSCYEEPLKPIECVYCRRFIVVSCHAQWKYVLNLPLICISSLTCLVGDMCLKTCGHTVVLWRIAAHQDGSSRDVVNGVSTLNKFTGGLGIAQKAVMAHLTQQQDSATIFSKLIPK